MAKKHIIEYYLQVQSVYFEMLQDAKEFDKELAGGYLTQEQVQQSQEMLESIKDNYDRLSYIILLLNMPTKDKKAKKHIKQNQVLFDYTAGISREMTLQDMQDELKQFRLYIKQQKENK